MKYINMLLDIILRFFGREAQPNHDFDLDDPDDLLFGGEHLDDFDYELVETREEDHDRFSHEDWCEEPFDDYPYVGPSYNDDLGPGPVLTGVTFGQLMVTLSKADRICSDPDGEYYYDDFDPFYDIDDWLDAVQISQTGGSLSKMSPVSRKKKADTAEETDVTEDDSVSFSDLPASWQARGRGACKHKVSGKAEAAKIRRLKRTCQRKARETIRDSRLADRNEAEHEYRLDLRVELENTLV